MNCVPKYKGKTIYQITKQELKLQYEINKKRLIIRTIFLLLISVITLIEKPIAIFIPILVLIITDYWLLNNNKKIKELL